MMSNFIPKSRSGDYRPWQLASLEGGGNKQSRDRDDAERIKMINQQAYRQGYDAGYAKGAAQAAAQAARLSALVDAIGLEMAALEQRVAEDLVRLALVLARSLVRESLKVHPELIEAIVRESVRDVPPFGQGTRLRLNPRDAALLGAHLTQELGTAWTIVEDAALTPGGCKLETAACEIDATLETRWQKLCAALAQDCNWIA
ncbi:MAG: flagellar assembly protein FliH [Burkholderiales bacterium]|nr:flagellar assembly protein FliH [Burkholderiales bacterium]